jgi:hypothetical protein
MFITSVLIILFLRLSSTKGGIMRGN